MMLLVYPKVLAHRGTSISAPENTLAAFADAKKAGCDWVEFDVELSKDGVPVILHDEMLDRTTTGHGPVDSLTLKELKKLDAGGCKSPQFANEKIPTFKETLDFIHENHMHANIELKSIRNNISQDVNLAKAACRVLEPYLGDENHYIVSSFSVGLLAEARKWLPSLSMGLCIQFTSKDDLLDKSQSTKLVLDKLGCYSLHVNEDIVDAETIMPLKRICPRILCWTVNEVERARALFEVGVDGIFTDDPATLIYAGYV